MSPERRLLWCVSWAEADSAGEGTALPHGASLAAGEGTRYSLVASLTTRVPPWWEERTDPTVDL